MKQKQRKFCYGEALNDDSNNDWFYTATYQSYGECQTTLQFIITPADQLITYIKILSLQTFTSKCFRRSLSQVPFTPGGGEEIESKAPF